MIASLGKTHSTIAETLSGPAKTSVPSPLSGTADSRSVTTNL